MKAFTAPLVILVVRPSLVPEGVEALLEEYGILAPYRIQNPEHYEYAGWQRDYLARDGDSIPELMGRLCYGSFGERQGRIGAKTYMANVLDGGHGSVLEHANWSFVVCRAGRGFTHQMVRHRAGFAFSQESQHFIKYSADGEPGAPEAAACLTGIPPSLHQQFLGDIEQSVRNYAALWADIRKSFPDDAKGLKKTVSGAARGLLPTALESRLGFTGNARALRHFCILRGDWPDQNKPHPNVLEVRLVAVSVARIMKVEAPALFQDVEVADGPDGYSFVHSVKGWDKV